MADKDLLERVAQALQPGAVEPPRPRVRALRDMVEAGAPTRANGAGDTTELVAQALRVGPVEPPPERVAALRALVSAPAGSATPSEVETPAPEPRPGEVHDLSKVRERRHDAARVSKMVSGLMAAAAVSILVAMVAINELPGALREVANGVGLPVESPERVDTEKDLGRLELALARNDAAEVAEADKALLESTRRLRGDDLRELEARAVRLHLAAVAFLRDNPTPGALDGLPTGEPAPGTQPLVPGGGAAGPAPPGSPSPATPTPTTPSGGSSTQQPPPPPTAPPQPPKVTITSIGPRLDATFQVDFQVSGFTPGPGSAYTVHFSFDDNREPSSYSGASPWTFPLLNAIRYRQVCARVADASGVEVPNSGNCKNILLL